MIKIILTGPKHCGKTSTGRLLAKACSCDFIDLDEEIFRQTGKTPRQLFLESSIEHPTEHSGGDLFKKAEANAAAAIAERKSGFTVLAAGGGIIDNPEAIIALKNTKAAVVYLNVSANTAWERIVLAGDLPPFLKTENPQETHRTLHERRAAEYLKTADFIIEADRKTSDEILAEIIKAFDLS
ncbi:MAG: shikimate kinase [Treponema sp.]|nr:shikimate kinase [Treponema sp.]